MTKHNYGDYPTNIVERNANRIHKLYGATGIVFAILIIAICVVYYDNRQTNREVLAAAKSQMELNGKYMVQLEKMNDRIDENTERLNTNKRDMERGLHTVDENHMMLENIQRSLKP